MKSAVLKCNAVFDDAVGLISGDLLPSRWVLYAIPCWKIARKIKISGPAIHQRIRKLESKRFVAPDVAVLDAE